MPGSGDLIGWRQIDVGDCMLAQFLSVEVKKPGENAREDQKHWQNVVNSMGGHAIVAHSVEEALKLIR